MTTKKLKPYSIIQYMPELHRKKRDPYREEDKQPHGTFPVVYWDIFTTNSRPSTKLNGWVKRFSDIGAYYYDRKGNLIKGDDALKLRGYTVKLPKSTAIRASNKAYMNAEKRIDSRRKEWMSESNYNDLLDTFYEQEKAKEFGKIARHARIKKRYNKGKTSLRR